MIRIEDAHKIAQEEVERRRQTSEFWRQVTDLTPVRLKKDTPEFWLFFARSEKLIDASHVPGGMHVTVDKQSGRIWTRPEIEAYYEARAASARQKIAA